jgi:hypothetical protein
MPSLSWNEVRDRAIRFSRRWRENVALERSEKQTFWNEFFEVFGIRRASVASFEENVRNLRGNTSAIDLLWRGKLLVEHKSPGEDLSVAATQAFTYIEDLTRENRWDEIPRFVLVSDFAHFVLYDLEPDDQADLPLFAGRKIEPHQFALADFPRRLRAFAFMLGQTRVRLDPEDPANEKAYARMCELHDSLRAGGFAGHDLERLLCRVLFCLFAEDTGIFAPDAFTQFIRSETRTEGSDLGARLNELFDWLNNPQADGSVSDTDWRHGFRYVNGGLFQQRLGFPSFTKAMRDALLFCCEFEWSRISPAVFGSLFQGVIDDRARRQQGAHYTSERDIMKVVRSLFLDDLQQEWRRLEADRSTRRRANMDAFHERLSGLHFLDPACGCGNFLVLAYRELRSLEFDVIHSLHGDEQGILDMRRFCRVDVNQFHGIEISEWPVRIAEVAMWLMDHQMNKEASGLFGQSYERLPLASSPHIVCGNALRMDWNDVLPKERCSFVMGNPPFVGKHLMNPEQEHDVSLVWGELSGAGFLDYVTAWYRKAVEYVQSTRIPVAFVSTNSITQGEQVGILWSELFQHWQVKIHFAHRTFVWMSEARGKAHVHVVIIGFGAFDQPVKYIYEYEDSSGEPTVSRVANISPYLVAGADVALPIRRKPICDVPEIVNGNKPTDGGFLIIEDHERSDFLRENPSAEPYLKPFLCAEEYLNGKNRWVLWLLDAPPQIIRDNPGLRSRVESVRAFRLRSPKASTRARAAVPCVFDQIRQPCSEYIVIPRHSSENRRYVPFGYFGPDIIIGDSCTAIASATLYDFGVISSALHMAWLRAVCGRLKSDYRYSNKLVYNNYPWPSPTPEQRAKVEACAAAVLTARERHLPPQGMSTLADLYDPLTMPPELLKAHAALDRAVEKCYRPEPFRSDRERVEHLFRLYEQLTAPLLPASPRTRARRSHANPAAASSRRRARTPGLPGASQPSTNDRP